MYGFRLCRCVVVCAIIVSFMALVAESTTIEQSKQDLAQARQHTLAAVAKILEAQQLIEAEQCTEAPTALDQALSSATDAKTKIEEILADPPSGLSADELVTFAQQVQTANDAVNLAWDKIKQKFDECTGMLAMQECCTPGGVEITAIINDLETTDAALVDTIDLMASGAPSLSQWGMIVLVLMLLAAGALVIRRRRALAGA